MAKRPIATNEITGILAYLMTIDWEERWIWFLVAFHILCFGLTALSLVCQRTWAQIVLFLSYLSVVLFSEKLNELAAENWKLFAEQQYFDSSGMFISLMLSTPLVINSTVMVIAWMVTSFQLAVKSKRLQLSHSNIKHDNDKAEQKKDQ